MRAQASSLPFTPIFASLVAIVNTKLPQIGELLLHRLVHQFRRSYKRNDKVRVSFSPSTTFSNLTSRLPQATMTATTTFLAQLCNQHVAHELLALQVLVLLLERPTDDYVEIAVSFMREVGAFLAENSPKANHGIFDRFRTILNESEIDKRVQYMVEVLFQVRKEKFKDNPIIPDGLDLVEEDDAITHRMSLDDEVQVQEMLSEFSECFRATGADGFRLFLPLPPAQTSSSSTPSTARMRRNTRRSRLRFSVKSRMTNPERTVIPRGTATRARTNPTMASVRSCFTFARMGS